MKRIFKLTILVFIFQIAVFGQGAEVDLDKGELKVSSSKIGKYREATAIGIIEAPPEEVWNIITDYESHPKFMPLQKYSKIVKVEGNTCWVDLKVNVGLSEMELTNKNVQTIMSNKRIVSWEQVEGPFTLSTGHWIIEPYKNGKTKATYTASLGHPILPNALAEKIIKDSFPELFAALRKRVSDMMKEKADKKKINKFPNSLKK